MRYLFLDLEVSAKKEIIRAGAIDQDANNVFNGNDIRNLNHIIKDYDVIVGHNFLNHDLEFLLRHKDVDISLKDKFIIDTLWLSSLIFIRHPYHRLIKDYKIDKVNDPIEDSKLCKEVFDSCCEEFCRLDGSIQNILFELLGRQKEFATFFSHLIRNKLFSPVQIDIYLEIKNLLKNNLDEEFYKHTIYDVVLHYPIETAYVLRLIYIKSNIDKDISVLPGRIVRELPHIHTVFQLIAKHKIYDSQKELKRWFGYDEFKTFQAIDGEVLSQKQVVEAALNKEDFLTIFATGGGKSLSFQLPAFMIAEQIPYLTIVISPLQSLMKDQVDGLNSDFNIHNVGFLNSTLNPIERKEVIEKIEFGGIDLLYLSPEMLRTKSTKKILSKRLIDRIVIDEAHCFSKWGHDFRIDYMFIADFIKELSKENQSLKQVNISCFTATAKQDVADEIKQYFEKNLEKKLIEYRSSAKRSNLVYRAKTLDNDDLRFDELLKILKQEVGDSPCIIFTRYTGKTDKKIGAQNLSEKINAALGENKAVYYHGQLKSQMKREIQDAFISGDINIIVATNAFGMGVNKKDVRHVIHYGVPSSLENYLQESGRAGRDGETSYCSILHLESDLDENLQLNKSSEVKHKEIKDLLHSLKNRFKKLPEISKGLTKSAKNLVKDAGRISEGNFDETYHNSKGIWEIKMKTALYFLEKFRFIRRTFNSTRLFATSKNNRKLSEVLEDIAKIPDLTDKEIDLMGSIFKHICESSVLSIEDLGNKIGWHFKKDKNHAERGIVDFVNILRDEKIIEQDDEISTVLNFDFEKTSLEVLNDVNVILSQITQIIPDNIDRGQVYSFDKRKINTQISKDLGRVSVAAVIDMYLNFLKDNHFVVVNMNQILFKKSKIEIYEITNKLLKQGKDLINLLLEDLSVNQRSSKNISQLSKLSEIIKKFNLNLDKTEEINISGLEEILKFLNRFEVIRVEGGLFLYHTKFQILADENLFKEKFNKDKYKDLEDFYEKKVEQAHIMEEFVKKVKIQTGSNSHIDSYIDDYFGMEYEDFLNKFFKNRRGEIKRPLSKKKYAEIYDSLSEQQLNILKSKGNQLIMAGPGAGKTKSLVHKIASLILEDGINTEEFLLLSFSRSAKFELKERVIKILGNYGYRIKIDTFHSFCFKLLQRDPQDEDLGEGQNIIKDAIEYLEGNQDFQLPFSVLMIDEFQDVNDEQYKLIEMISLRSSGGEKMKIIATGDDDQNIFGFQGGKVEYIQNFKNNYNAEQFVLDINYRSTQKIVDFNNQFIKTCSNRIKSGMKLHSYRDQHGMLVDIQDSLIEAWNCSGYYLSFVNDAIKRINKPGNSTAIICHNNETCLAIKNLLEKQGHKPKLLLKSLGYNTITIIEIKYFMFVANDENNPISKENMRSKYDRVIEKYGENKNTNLLFKILEHLEKTVSYVSLKVLADFVFGLKESDLEKTDENGDLVISTFHKAKGREFDNVIVCFDPHMDRNKSVQNVSTFDDMKRLIYVGLTRARNNLIILGSEDNTYFSMLEKKSEYKEKFNQVYDVAKEIDFVTDATDINLGYNYFKKSKNKIVPLGCICELVFENDIASFRYNGVVIQTASKSFSSKLKKYLSKGYKVESVTVFQRLHYFLKKQQKFTLVYLFQVSMSL